MSRSHTGISGYHCEYQSNFWAPLSISGSVTEVDSVEIEWDTAVKSLDFDFFLSTKESVGLIWRLKNMGFLVSSGVEEMCSEGTEKGSKASIFANRSELKAKGGKK